MCSTPPATASTTDPDGGAPLSDAAKRRRKRNADKILARDGDFRCNLAYRGDRDSVEVGGPGSYAGARQFGAAKGALGTTLRGGPWGDILACPFLGLSHADRAEELTRNASTRPQERRHLRRRQRGAPADRVINGLDRIAFESGRSRTDFTPRQPAALTMSSDLVAEARERVERDAGASGEAYADAVAAWLAIGKLANR